MADINMCLHQLSASFLTRNLTILPLTKVISEDQQLSNELHRRNTTKFKKCKVYSPHSDDIQGADLAGMKLISKYKKGLRFLLCGIGIYSKYIWVVPVKDIKGISITNAFQKFLDESDGKVNNIQANKVVISTIDQ